MGLIALLGLILAPAASAQVGISVQWLYPIESLYLADVSPYTAGAQPEFLSILLTGGTGQQNVVMELTLQMEQPTTSQVFVGSTDPFTLAPATRLTNRDLTCSNCPYGIEHTEIAAEFEERVYDSGRFPAGSYILRIRLLTATGIEFDRDEVRIEFTNPSRIELVAPGRMFGDTPEIVTSTTPRFVWSSDEGPVPGGSEYRIRVVPVDGAGSAEDAMQQFASWDEVTNATSAIYPGSVAAIPLEPGGTYAWQIIRQVRGSAGEELLESPIYWFRMAGTGAGGDTGGAVGSLAFLRALALALGIDLTGFSPTGQIFVDGVLYPAERLEELLRAIIAGEVSVSSITVL